MNWNPATQPPMTTHAAKRMVRFLNAEPASCTITEFFRTMVFDFRGADLAAGAPDNHHVIYSHAGVSVTILADLKNYFEATTADYTHYTLDVTLRERINQFDTANARSATRRGAPLFVVAEEHVDVHPTTLDRGECYRVDERIDGDDMIVGGRDGKRTLVAFPTTDGSWPSFDTNIGRVMNVVLAALAVEQRLTGYFEAKCDCMCFSSTDGEVVRYGGTPTALPVQVDTVSEIDHLVLEQKANSIRSMIARLGADMNDVIAEVVDAVALNKTHDDAYLRLWYLRLWEAIAGKQVKKAHLAGRGKCGRPESRLWKR